MSKSYYQYLVLFCLISKCYNFGSLQIGGLFQLKSDIREIREVVEIVKNIGVNFGVKH